MNQLLEQIYKTGSVEDVEGNSINPFPVATPRETGAILYELIKEYNLENTLEIGMAYGLSTLSFCQAHQDKGTGSHVAIDPIQTKRWKAIGLLNVKRASLDHRLRFFEAKSHEVLPELLKQRETFDLIFIDGLHLFDYVLLEFFYADKLLKPGGFLVFDDIWMPGIRKAISFILTNRNYELTTIGSKSSFLKRTSRIMQRFLQTPLEGSIKLKFSPENICLLRKVSEDTRDWTFHRSF
jgi:predicted O-methyltransferase YrrM